MAEIAVTAAIITGAATAAGAPLANFGLQQLKSKTEGHTSLPDMHKALNDGLKRLHALLKDKEREVSRYVIQKDTTNAYLLWVKRVSNIEKDVASLNTKYDGGVQTNIWLGKNRGLKKEIKKALEGVIKLLDEECPKEILVDKLPERVIKEISVPSIVEYRTLQKAFQDIQDELKDEEVKCVLLHGQKGAGKTTIMKHLNNHHFYDNSIDKEFNVVIFIKVAADEKTKDLNILQKIADRIKVDREGNEFEVAGRIQTMLENKRYLLILDGVRRSPDGIWEMLDISKDKRDSKVVITTSFPLALKSKCVDRIVKLETLSHKEAWDMFRNIVGDNHLPDKPNARLVCKRFCRCLPLLIDPIARSFKYQESPTDWKRALNERTPWPQVGVDGLKELSSKLEICYQLLGDPSRQKCFLYASLYPANSNICSDHLVECCIVHGFLGDVDADTKYSEMRSRGIQTILKHLVNVAFLEGGEQVRHVKMNDLYRELALHISSKDSDSGCRTYVDNEEHEEPVRSKSWQHAKWVSMVGSNRNSLPTYQNYGSLQTLLLQKNMKLVEIPSAYFDSMGNLLVLNLYAAKISKLPSLEGLARLKAFYLNGCSELKICSQEIQPLKHLQVFDIRGTGVNFLPCLESLRCLRISFIASGDQGGDQGNYHLIPKLHKLEELIIEVKSLPQWCKDAEDILQKVASLENLTTFRCSFPSSEMLQKFLDTCKSCRGTKHFTSFHFFVGCEDSKHPKIIDAFDNRIFKYVKYCYGDKKHDLAITKVLPQVEAFELICHNNVGNLSELVKTSNLEGLRGLLIERCNQMSIVVAGDMLCNAINSTLPENASLLPNLEQLHLDNLLHLRCVFRGSLHPGSFSLLHTLTLKNCPVLTSIFSISAVDDFSELQKLVVQNCSSIEILIRVKKVIEMEQNILPKLEMLILDNLLNFRSICPNENLKWPSLEQINVQKCAELKSLPFNTTNAAKLKTIKGEKEWWNNLKWTTHEDHKRFQYAFSAST